MEDLIPKVMAVILMLAIPIAVWEFLKSIYYIHKRRTDKREYESLMDKCAREYTSEIRTFKCKTSLQKYCNHKRDEAFDLPPGHGVEFIARQNR